MSTILINPAALQHNLQRVRELAPASKVLAMLKANAYGHGLERVAQILKGVEAFGVAQLSEALRLRKAGVVKPVVVMTGALTFAELETAVAQNIELVFHRQAQVSFLSKLKIKPSRVWIKVNTGMNRLGFLPAVLPELAQSLAKHPEITEIVWLTHFANSDHLGDPMTDQQAQKFFEAVQGLPGEKSLSASCSILSRPDLQADWVRPGMMLYGASPFPGKTAADFNLRPVMTLQAPVIAIHDCETGESIGYGSTYTCPRACRIAVLGLGYGDGYPRHLPQGVEVLLQGQLCPIVGRVSMDMVTVEVSDLSSLAVGERATFWGEGLPIEILAERLGTIPYELLTHIAPRQNL